MKYSMIEKPDAMLPGQFSVTHDGKTTYHEYGNYDMRKLTGDACDNIAAWLTFTVYATKDIKVSYTLEADGYASFRVE